MTGSTSLPPMRARLAVAVTAAVTALMTAGAATAGASAPPPEEKAPSAFVALSAVDPTIMQEMRYVRPHNFVGEPVDGYRQPVCLLTRPAAQALHRAQINLLRQGYSLKVYDCYRPQRAVDHFVRWAQDLGDERRKAEFYPRVEKSRLFEDGYIAKKSGHSRGSTMDVTLVRLRRFRRPGRGRGRSRCPATRPGRSGIRTTRWTWARVSTASTRCRTPTTRGSRERSARTGTC